MQKDTKRELVEEEGCIDPIERKLRLQKLMEEADMELTRDLFSDIDSSGKRRCV
jgi:hypothetical protein